MSKTRTNYRLHSIGSRFKIFLVTLIMRLRPPLCPHSLNMLPATPETIRHWLCFMPTPSKHITHHPLGRSDHNLVHLLPVYEPLIHRQPAVARAGKRWSDYVDERHGCLRHGAQQGNSPGSLPLHPLRCRLHAQLSQLLPAEVYLMTQQSSVSSQTRMTGSTEN